MERPPRSNRRGCCLVALRRVRSNRKDRWAPKLVHPAKVEQVLQSIPESQNPRSELWQRILLERPLSSWTDSPIANQPLSYWVGCYRRWTAARLRPTVNSAHIKDVLLVSADSAAKLVSLFRRRNGGDNHEIWFFALITAGVLLSPCIQVSQKISFLFQVFDFQQSGELKRDGFGLLWKAVHVSLSPVFGVESKTAPPSSEITAYAADVFSMILFSQRTAYGMVAPSKVLQKKGLDWRSFAAWALEVEAVESLPWGLLLRRYSSDSSSSSSLVANLFRQVGDDDLNLCTNPAPPGPPEPSEVGATDPASPSEQRPLPSKIELWTIWKIWRSLREAQFRCIPDFVNFRQFLDTAFNSGSEDRNQDGWHPNRSMELRIFEVVREAAANLLRLGEIATLGDFGSFCSHILPTVKPRHLRIFRSWIERMEMDDTGAPSGGEICAAAAMLLAEESRPLVPLEERARLEQIFQDCDVERTGFVTLLEIMTHGFCEADRVAQIVREQGINSEEGLELSDFIACFCYPNYRTSGGAARRQVMSLFQEYIDSTARQMKSPPSLILPDVPSEWLREWSAMFLNLSDRSGEGVKLQHLLHTIETTDFKASSLWREWAKLEPDAVVSFNAYVLVMCMARRYRPPLGLGAQGAEEVMASTPRVLALPPVKKPAHQTYSRGGWQKDMPQGLATLRYRRLQGYGHIT